MTPDEVREIVRDELGKFAEEAFEALAPAVVGLLDTYGLLEGMYEAPFVGPVILSLTELFLPNDDDQAAA